MHLRHPPICHAIHTFISSSIINSFEYLKAGVTYMNGRNEYFCAALSDWRTLDFYKESWLAINLEKHTLIMWIYGIHLLFTQDRFIRGSLNIYRFEWRIWMDRMDLPVLGWKASYLHSLTMICNPFTTGCITMDVYGRSLLTTCFVQWVIYWNLYWLYYVTPFQ